jgi:hypothetical protein
MALNLSKDDQEILNNWRSSNLSKEEVIAAILQAAINKRQRLDEMKTHAGWQVGLFATQGKRVE